MILPEQISQVISELRTYVAEACEVSLADWQWNPNSGAWVKLRLPDESHLQVYNGKDRAGRTQKFGQRYYMILVEVGDDEIPVNQDGRTRMEQENKPPRKLSQIAGGLCHDEAFRTWLQTRYEVPIAGNDDAADIIRMLCGVESRSHLDSNEGAAEVFRGMLAEYDQTKA